jgi:anti-sigma factor (TIGR02949 family)
MKNSPLKPVEATVDCRDVERLLDAYIDLELEPDESAAVREHFGTCVHCLRALSARDAIGRLIRQAPYYPAPARLRTRLAQSRTPATWSSRRRAWAVAALLAVSVSGSLLISRWPARTPTPTESVAEAVVDSHVRALMGEHLFDVRSTDQHTVKPWFLGKLDFSPPVDDLARLGFPLTGGRLDYVAGRPAAALVYTRGQHTINLFIWPAAPGTEPVSDTVSIRGFHVRHWTRAAISFWAVSDLNDLELDQFVHALQP